MMEYQRGLACMVFNFFDRKTTGNGVTKLANKSAIKYAPQNEQLLKNEPIIKKLKKNKSVFSIQGWMLMLGMLI